MLYLRVSASQQNMIQLGRSCDETTAYHFSALHLKVISNHPPSLFNTCSSSYRLFPHSCLTSRHFGAKFDIFHPSSAKRTLVMVVGRTGDGSSCWLHTSTLTSLNNRRQAEPGRAFYQYCVKRFSRNFKNELDSFTEGRQQHDGPQVSIRAAPPKGRPSISQPVIGRLTPSLTSHSSVLAVLHDQHEVSDISVSVKVLRASFRFRTSPPHPSYLNFSQLFKDEYRRVSVKLTVKLSANSTALLYAACRTSALS